VAKPLAMVDAGGKWNTCEIAMKGPQLTVTLNGTLTAQAKDKKLVSGPIALQYFRAPCGSVACRLDGFDQLRHQAQINERETDTSLRTAPQARSQNEVISLAIACPVDLDTLKPRAEIHEREAARGGVPRAVHQPAGR
jgi:hypothetical protein